MTVNSLIKKLQKIEKKYGKRIKVTVDIEHFRLMDGDFSHWAASDIGVQDIRWSKEDSYLRADGSERWITVAVIS